jgi:uncharacterized protein (DUF1800 family)
MSNRKKVNPALLIAGIFILTSFMEQPSPKQFPYAKAGLTERKAAAHLLGRFTYGATADEIENVVSQGLENWFEKQLNASFEDTDLEKRLQQYPALTLSNAQISSRYFRNGQILKMAMRDGVINDSSVNNDNKKQYRDLLREYAREKGIDAERELVKQFASQKILRSVYSQNQLQEVLSEFWFNHFNVSFTKGNCAKYIPNYERDVIRPNALGTFEDLLMATAKSPAMLMYLDNFNSVAEKTTTKAQTPKKRRGLNENYAREIMELHTLGVDGGYTQHDVTEVARILTGWTVYPMNGNPAKRKNMPKEKVRQKPEPEGTIREGDFLFVENRHDQGEKNILGKYFSKGGGYGEGITVLKMLANHSSTATFISRKIAVRFVNDDPPQSLVEKMSNEFIKTGGDIKSILLVMVTSDEFWAPGAFREKTKSPFELAISAVRVLKANVVQPFQLYRYISGMGHKLYHYQAPTGFPDHGKFWINSGALLSRMNFGLDIASGKIPGIRLDLLKLNDNHEPESSTDALKSYGAILMPERELEETIRRLTPLLNHPEIENKIKAAANDSPGKTEKDPEESPANLMEDDSIVLATNRPMADNQKYQLAQIVGILLGSPEFQRR